MMTILPTLGAIAVPVIAGVLSYILNQRAERRSRATQYQLEQIERILVAIASSGTLRMTLSNLSDEEADAIIEMQQDALVTREIEARVEIQRAMTLIPLYGNDDVLAVVNSERTNPNGSYTAEETRRLSEALIKQGRELLRKPRRRRKHLTWLGATSH